MLSYKLPLGTVRLFFGGGLFGCQTGARDGGVCVRSGVPEMCVIVSDVMAGVCVVSNRLSVVVTVHQMK